MCVLLLFLYVLLFLVSHGSTHFSFRNPRQDAGFQQGRQYGRGVHGGQVRDDRRHAGAKRSRESQQTPRVSLDGALPSSRQEKASYYGDNKDGNIKQEAPSDEAAPSQEEPDESTDEPSAKRVKLE